jgi:probable F420-dependent oxidoreductase
MKFWLSLSGSEAHELIEIAQLAEATGFHGVVCAEHLFLPKETQSRYPYGEDGKLERDLDFAYPDVWASFGAMAAVTTRLRFSSAIYLLPLRSPFDVAKATGTLALISNNRVALGIGVGWQQEEFAAVGIDFHTRGKRTDEMIEVMHKLWRGGLVSHHGRFFDFIEIRMAPVPSEPVPIYGGGSSPAALRRAASLCDGYIGPGHRLEDVPGLLGECNRLRREAERDQVPFETIVPIKGPGAETDVDMFKRLEAMGVTATVAAPFDASRSALGRNASPARKAGTTREKMEAMEEYAVNVIDKMT